MTSKTTPEFWKRYQRLPESVQRLADKNYKLWLENLRHPSIQFKKLAGHDSLYSARVGTIIAPFPMSKAIPPSGRGLARTKNTINSLGDGRVDVDQIHHHWLTQIEAMDNIFPEVNWRYWA